jgi:hypothetical protein
MFTVQNFFLKYHFYARNIRKLATILATPVAKKVARNAKKRAFTRKFEKMTRFSNASESSN